MSLLRVPAVWIPLLAMAYAFQQLELLPPLPATEPDCEGYLSFGAYRSAGYPIFLKVLGAELAMRAQPVLYALALAFLGWESYRASGSGWLALAVMSLAMMDKDLNHYHAYILTESLYASLLAVLPGLGIRAIHQPGASTLASMGAVAGMAAAVRPTGYALLPVLAMVPFWLPNRYQRRRSPSRPDGRCCVPCRRISRRFGLFWVRCPIGVCGLSFCPVTRSASNMLASNRCGAVLSRNSS